MYLGGDLSLISLCRVLIIQLFMDMAEMQGEQRKVVSWKMHWIYSQNVQQPVHRCTSCHTAVTKSPRNQQREGKSAVAHDSVQADLLCCSGPEVAKTLLWWGHMAHGTGDCSPRDSQAQPERRGPGKEIPLSDIPQRPASFSSAPLMDYLWIRLVPL